MVVDDVHDDVDALGFKGLHHFLQLPDPDVTVVGIGGIDALDHVVVEGIVAPVEGRLRLIVGLVEDREELDGIDAEPDDRVEAGRDALAVLLVGSSAFDEALVEMAVRGRSAPSLRRGDVGHVGLVDDEFLPVVRKGLDLVPALGIGLRKVDDHPAEAVDSGALGIGVDDFPAFRIGGAVDGIGVVGAGEVFFDRGFVDAFLAERHRVGFLFVASLARIDRGRGSVRVDVQLDLLARRGPDLEGGRPVEDLGSEVIAFVGIVLLELVGLVKGVAVDFLLEGRPALLEGAA